MCELDLPLLALKMEEEGHESRNVGDLYKLEKARKWVLPWSLQKGMQPAAPFIFAQCDLCWILTYKAL